jgi:hypothetical protein
MVFGLVLRVGERSGNNLNSAHGLADGLELAGVKQAPLENGALD